MEKAPISDSKTPSGADAEAGESVEVSLRFKSKFNNAEYERWSKALKADRAAKKPPQR